MQGLLQTARFRCILGFIVVVLLGSCATIADQDRYLRLQRSVERYASDIRWGRYDTAATFIARKDSKPSSIDARKLEEIRVIGYEMATGELSRDAENASITVTFDYYDTSSGRLQTLADVQEWWYNDSVNRWFLDGNLPDFLRDGYNAR